MLDEVKEFADTLHKETIESQQIVEQKVQEEYKKVEGEIKQYKDEQMAKIEESIYDILHDVSHKVMGKALSLKDHEALVLEALEEAKRSNVISK